MRWMTKVAGCAALLGALAGGVEAAPQEANPVSYENASGALVHVLNESTPDSRWSVFRPTRPDPRDEGDLEVTSAAIVRASMAERCVLALDLEGDGAMSRVSLDFRRIVEGSPDGFSVLLMLQDDANIYRLTLNHPTAMHAMAAVLSVGHIHRHCSEGA